jgi:xanthine dehydrogenase accessory factor
MRYSFPKLLETLIAGKGLVLATIVETEGSTPQVVGASAIFSKAGLEAGTVGGGILEARVEAMAGEALREGVARLVPFQLDADPKDAEGAICGGAARVLIDPGVSEELAVFKAALESLRKRRPGCLVTEIVSGTGDAVRIERRFEEAGREIAEIEGAASKDCRPRLVESASGRVFYEPVSLMPRLIIAGAGHVGRAVARLGGLLDFSVTVIDDRAEFANEDNVPEADEIVVGAIGERIRAIEDSPDNYFVVVTRGHHKDAEALRAAIGRPAAYIGMIGSGSKVEAMHREFLESGWATAAEWAGIHAPIGLDIGSKTVEEIAVSIAAELVLVRSGRKGAGRGRP